jgi:hypothetical protein
MNADADRQRPARQGLDRGLHGERRATGAHRMVFLGIGRAEQRHDTITLDLDDRPLETPNRLVHGLDGGREPPGRLFGIEPLDQLGRSGDVGEQYGDLLEFTVAGRRFAGGGLCCECRTALPAEARGRRVARMAGRTWLSKRRAAIYAESGVASVVGIAGGATHL